MRRTIAMPPIAGAILTLATVVSASADFKVRMPDANPGEIAVEPLGDYGHDPNPAHSGELSSVQEFEYGVNGFWRTELELEQKRNAGPGQSLISTRSLRKTSFNLPSAANTGSMPACLPSSAGRHSGVTRTNSPWDRCSARRCLARSTP